MNPEPDYIDAEDPPRSQRRASRGKSKVTGERVALLVVSALLVAAAVVIYRLAFDKLRANKHLQTLREENEALRRNPSEWTLYRGKWYYFSTDFLSWEKGRRECQADGGDLVKIDSLEEQSFLVNHLRKNQGTAQLWIGLTDSVEEGRWVWVDGSPLDPSMSLWSGTEPDDWTVENPKGEDCAKVGYTPSTEELKAWFDRSCEVPHRFICEKTVEPGRDTCP